MVSTAGGAMGGTGESRHLLSNLRWHLHGGGKKDQLHAVQTPKGCVAVMVGGPHDGEERRRFVVPVAYLGHPRFLRLLKEAEDEYGFHHEGAIAIPCRVAEFLSVQDLIDRDLFPSLHHHHGSGGGGHHHHFHHNLVGCFRA